MNNNCTTKSVGQSETRRPAHQYEAILRSLVEYVHNKQPYLDPTLSLKDLAREVGVNVNYMSQAINQGTGVSFKVYINRCRADHAIALLRKAKGMISSKELCHQSGFGSSSTFHTYFRARTGVTPQQYVQSFLSTKKGEVLFGICVGV